MLISAKRMAVLAVSSLLLCGAMVAAQEATPQAIPNGTIVCDSSLVLDLYTAENFFGFSQIMSMVQNPDPALMADVSTLDKGQYAPLFASLNRPVPLVSSSDEQNRAIANAMSQNDDAMQAQLATVVPVGTDLSTLTALNVPSIADEDPTCTVLRNQLNRFFMAVNLQHSGSVGAANGTADATAEPSAGGAIGGSNSTGSSISGNGGASSSTSMPGNGSQLTPPPGGGSPGGNG